MRNVFELEQQTQVLQNDSYIISHPHIISYFAGLEEIGESDLVRGAHMVYGWMPTVLNLYPEPPNKSLAEVSLLLTVAKNSGVLENSRITSIAAVVNNSMVGASKLLHFVAPQYFAIWDSKIYAFVHEKKPHNYRVNKVEFYRDYLDKLNKIQEQPAFTQFHLNVNEKVGYEVTAMRAIELVMFLNAPISGG